MFNPAKWILQQFSDTEIPVGGKIYQMHTTEFMDKIKYDYASIEKLLEDERVYSIVAIIASMACKAYVGPELYPKDRFKDDELSDKEQNAIQAAVEISRTLNFRQLFYNYAWQLVSHGDLFERIVKSGKGIDKLVSLPLNAVKVVANEEQIVKFPADLQILEENMIAVRRNANDRNPTIYRDKEYLHLSFKNHGVWRKDIEGIDTYGIYSIPPIAVLQRLVNWKKKTIENDILWKNKLLPRILHKLKMPSIVPSKYTGIDHKEKVAKAKADADAITTSFINMTKILRPDDDIVTSDAVDTSILEAKSTNYAQPNETLSQINTFLNTPQGIPNGLLGGESGASMGIELASIFAGIRVDYLVKNIANAVAEVMKSHVRIAATSAGEDVIDRLFIHVDPTLSVEKFQKVKIALAMAATQIFTKREIRESAGYVAIPKLDQGLFPTEVNVNAKASLEEIEKNISQEGSNSEKNNTSPQAKRNTTEEQR